MAAPSPTSSHTEVCATMYEQNITLDLAVPMGGGLQPISVSTKTDPQGDLYRQICEKFFAESRLKIPWTSEKVLKLKSLTSQAPRPMQLSFFNYNMITVGMRGNAPFAAGSELGYISLMVLLDSPFDTSHAVSGLDFILPVHEFGHIRDEFDLEISLPTLPRTSQQPLEKDLEDLFASIGLDETPNGNTRKFNVAEFYAAPQDPNFDPFNISLKQTNDILMSRLFGVGPQMLRQKVQERSSRTTRIDARAQQLTNPPPRLSGEDLEVYILSSLHNIVRALKIISFLELSLAKMNPAERTFAEDVLAEFFPEGVTVKALLDLPAAEFNGFYEAIAEAYRYGEDIFADHKEVYTSGPLDLVNGLPTVMTVEDQAVARPIVVSSLTVSLMLARFAESGTLTTYLNPQRNKNLDPKAIMRSPKGEITRLTYPYLNVKNGIKNGKPNIQYAEINLDHISFFRLLIRSSSQLPGRNLDRSSRPAPKPESAFELD